jgi:hypothetical protein
VRSVGRWRPAVLTLAGVLALAAPGCSRPPGSAETDRIAEVVADAISYPRQTSATGLARAALATRAGQDGRLRLVAIEELHAVGPQDPMARLVFLVHLQGSEGAFTTEPAVTACYEARFNSDGIIGSPRRIACPRGASPVTPPPATPEPEIAIPDGADELVERVLAAAGRRPDAEEVRASVQEGLRKAAAGDPAGREPPLPQVSTDGADVGVAMLEPDGRACLLGARVGGQVLVWRPSRVQLQPGELSCDPGTALARQGTRPPH